jgi:glycosyltransferase involved in cell wall biosynthesis
MKKKKIIHILYRATIGGSERVVYNLINEQIKNSYQVVGILLANGGGFLEKFKLLLNDKLFIFRIDKFQDVIKLYQFLKIQQQDWIIHNHVKNIKLGFILSQLPHRKILTEHLLTDQLKKVYPRSYRKLKLFYRLYEKDYAYITSVSHAVKDTLVNHFSIDEHRIKVIFNGIQASLSRKTGKNGNYNIGNATHFEKIKNIDLFLSIAEELARTDQSFKFFLIGDGAQKPNILSFINAKKLHKNISVLEPQEDLTSFFSQLNLGLITSLSESFSLFAAECLLRGIPVVASAIGGLKEVVSDNQCGYLIGSFRKEDFIEKILKLKNDIIIYHKFSEQARKASKQFLIENVYQKYHQLYCEIGD